MYFPILLASLGFIGFFIWYLAAENAATRRAAGVGAIVASLLTCGLALYPLNKTIRLGLDLQGGTEFLLQVQGNPNASGARPGHLGPAQAARHPRHPRNQHLARGHRPAEDPDSRPAGREVGQTEKILSQVAKLEFNLVPTNAQEILAGGAWPMAASCLINTRWITRFCPSAEGRAGKDVRSQIVVEKQGADVGQACVTRLLQDRAGWSVGRGSRIRQRRQAAVWRRHERKRRTPTGHRPRSAK